MMQIQLVSDGQEAGCNDECHYSIGISKRAASRFPTTKTFIESIPIDHQPPVNCGMALFTAITRPTLCTGADPRDPLNTNLQVHIGPSADAH
jgi:hypothetical protein